MKKKIAGFALVLFVGATLFGIGNGLYFSEPNAMDGDQAYGQARFGQMQCQEGSHCRIICQNDCESFADEITKPESETAVMANGNEMEISPIQDIPDGTTPIQVTEEPEALPEAKTSALTESLIPNPSFEMSDGQGNPASWMTSAWGDNSHQFIYDNTLAHTGNYSFRVEIGNWTDGDVKVASAPIPVGEKKKCFVSDWYMSDTHTRLVLEAAALNGSIQHIFLNETPPASQWTKYDQSTTLPDDIVSVVVFHVLEKPGWLSTDDYEVRFE